jgi:hypothetical protein
MPGTIAIRSRGILLQRMTSHGTLKRVRKRKKHGRKLSDNPQLFVFIIGTVICGLFLIGLLTFALSSAGCRLPKFLQ